MKFDINNPGYKLKKIIWIIISRVKSIFYFGFGSKSIIMNPLMIINKRYIDIGKNVLIRDGARIEAFLNFYKNEKSSIQICDNVSIEQCVHIISGGGLVIGRNTTISANVFISNIDHDYIEKNVHILNQKKIVRETKIGDNCFIGYGSCILPGTKLGKQCIVGANSVVKGDFPDFSVIAGNPARIIKYY